MSDAVAGPLVREGGSDTVPASLARSGFADALRGFALVGICVVNLPFMASPDHELTGAPAGLDAAAAFATSLLFEGKFFPLFSFLFGFGFATQLDRTREGGATGAAYARRLIGLGVLGALHAVLLFPGDILLSYALLGAPLWRVRHRPDRSLLRLAGVWVALPALCLALVGLAVVVAEPGIMAGARLAGAADAEAATRAYLGPFEGALERRLYHDLPGAAAAVVLFQWPLSFAAFCVGLVAGRRGVLQNPRRLQAALRPHLRLLCMGALAGNVAWAFSPWLPPAASVFAVFLLLAVGGPCLAALYALLIAVVWESGRGRRALGWLEPAGRMSLTNYLGQSLVANALFMGWGLGLYNGVGRPALLVVAPLIAGGLCALSHLWLRRFRIGPAEWLLRSWTTLHRQPLRRAG